MFRKTRKITAVLLCLAMVFGVFASLPNSVFAAENDEQIIGVNDTDIVSISAGFDMSSAVRADGSLWTWGNGLNTSNLGLAVGSKLKTPMMVISRDAQSAETGFMYGRYYKTSSSNSSSNTAVIKDDNSLWVFGTGNNGAIGNGNTGRDFQGKPLKILENVVDYDIAGQISGAVTSDGKLYMWGNNYYGQIGNNSTENVYSPVEVMSGVKSVSLGFEHSAVIKTDGSLWMWGSNKFGQLGIGTTDDSHIPVKVMDKVEKVELGDSFSLVLKSDGTVWSCGSDSSGALGKGTTKSYTYRYDTHYSNGATYIDDYWPTNVPDSDKVFSRIPDLEDIRDIDAGIGFAAAIDESDALWMWGANSSGKIGNGSTSVQPDPIITMRNVKMVSLGAYHTLAVKNDKTLWAWGDNTGFQLGDGTSIDKTRPVEITLSGIKADFIAGNKTNELDLVWDDNYLNKDSSLYNQDLAQNGIVLSEAAYRYNVNNASQNVFGQFGFNIVRSAPNNDSVDRPGYYIAYKIMYDFDEPRIEIIMAIRGTKSIFSLDAMTDLKAVNDGFDGAANYCYNELKSARSAIAEKVGELGLSMSKKNTRYFITGHSLGGACAGKMSLKMGNDGVAYPANIYTYTYAAPNYTNMSEKLDSVVEVPGIINIVNTADTVPTIPTAMYYWWLYRIPLEKAGKTYFLSYNSNISSFNSAIYDLYGEIAWDTYGAYKEHMTPTYLALLKADIEKKENSFLNMLFRVLSIHCPVDVEIYDSTGELCAYTNGTEVKYTKETGVRIVVVNDEKFVELPDENYTVKYKGTDSGTMKVEDQIISTSTGDVQSEKTFSNVVLEEGKLFESHIRDNRQTEKTDLYVLDSENDRVKTVDENGNETDLAKYDITKENIIFEGEEFKYDGSRKTPFVTIEGLDEGVDYRLFYQNDTEVGTASVTVKGINEYFGRVTQSYKIYDEGICGENLSWKLNADGTLTISGEGEMDNYTAYASAPWTEWNEKITKVVIDSDVTSIGDYAFYTCLHLNEIVIPEGVTEIGSDAFRGCVVLENITVPNSVRQIGDNAFASSGVETIYGYSGSYAEEYAAENNIAFEKINSDSSRIIGDVNGDNSVDVLDATLIQKYTVDKAELTDEQVASADVNNDNIVDILDATDIQKFSVDKITGFKRQTV